MKYFTQPPPLIMQLPKMKRSHDVAIDEKVEFDSLIQNKQLLQGLKQSGYEQPSPIQLKAIPLGRLGLDLIAQAKSGTGKTVVFGVITLESIELVVKHPQAIIIAPTREIAVQIRDVVRHLGQAMPLLKCEAFIGGLSIAADTQNLEACQVLVVTPGRLMALLGENKVNLNYMKLIVLDEADKLMSHTFYPQIKYIFTKLKNQHHQSIAFSATFTDDLLNNLKRFLKEPQIVKLTEGVPTLHEVQQYYVEITPQQPGQLQVYKQKFEAVESLLGKIPFYQCMIFINTMSKAIELSKWLNEMGWKAGHIHSHLAQEKRLAVMEHMRDFKLRVLICSDLISRGIDIDRVNLVINLDFPWEMETYLHRVGRTGRYGTSGIAINLMGPDDQPFLAQLLHHHITIHPLPDKVTYNTKFMKQLNEQEQKTYQDHQNIAIESKPIMMKRKPKAPRQHVVTQQRACYQPFIPPDLYF